MWTIFVRFILKYLRYHINICLNKKYINSLNFSRKNVYISITNTSLLMPEFIIIFKIILSSALQCTNFCFKGANFDVFPKCLIKCEFNSDSIQKSNCITTYVYYFSLHRKINAVEKSKEYFSFVFVSQILCCMTTYNNYPRPTP